MNSTSKVFAFLAYLLSVVGALFVLIFRRKDEFAVYHAKQSLGIGILAIAALITWFIAFWVLVWIPYAGPVLGFALFALVIAAYIVLTILCIIGMVHTLQMKQEPVPIVGTWILKQSSIVFRD